MDAAYVSKYLYKIYFNVFESNMDVIGCARGWHFKSILRVENFLNYYETFFIWIIDTWTDQPSFLLKGMLQNCLEKKLLHIHKMLGADYNKAS